MVSITSGDGMKRTSSRKNNGAEAGANTARGLPQPGSEATYCMIIATRGVHPGLAREIPGVVWSPKFSLAFGPEVFGDHIGPLWDEGGRPVPSRRYRLPNRRIEV